MKRLALVLLGVALAANVFPSTGWGQSANYDEAKVPQYTLPDPLVMADGRKVGDAATWFNQRRPEILALFETHVYGRSPGKPAELSFEVTSQEEGALGGKATRKEVSVNFAGTKDSPRMDLLIYIPAGAKGPVPAFVGLNFRGNHTIVDDPAVSIPTSWMPNDKAVGVVNHKASEEGRGRRASRWPVETVLARGYALATIYCGDIDPDFHDGFKNGVHPLFYKPGQSAPDPDQWGTIGAWAWGLSRAMDYFETDPAIDEKKVAVMGHSRLGKTSLWAGAQDTRFAIVISNNSGCGGAALSRRQFGETVKRINSSFPHWFCGNFKRYNDDVDALPVDQHMLVALMAPRPCYIASAEKDQWADPRGEFLSALHAEPVYKLLGAEGLGAADMPALDEPVGAALGYHIRRGGHDVTLYDWERYLDFADKHFGVKK